MKRVSVVVLFVTAMVTIMFHLSLAEPWKHHHRASDGYDCHMFGAPPHHWGPGPDGHLLREGPGLTDWDLDQRARVSAIEREAQKEAIRFTANLRIIGLDVEDGLHKEPVDMRVVEEKIRDRALILSELDLLHIRTVERIRAELTPEQREQFRRLRAEDPYFPGFFPPPFFPAHHFPPCPPPPPAHH